MMIVQEDRLKSERDGSAGRSPGQRPALVPPAAKRRIDVEALLVWAYAKECVDCIGDPHGVALSSGYNTLGTMISGSTWMSRERLIESIHPDAIQVHRAVLALDARPELRARGTAPSALVIEHAKAETRPNWGEGVSARLEMVPSGRFDTYSGKPMPKIVWTDARRHYGWCEVSTAGGEAFIAFCRDIYLTWWLALHAAAMALIEAGTLGRHDVGPPAAPAEPWATTDRA